MPKLLECPGLRNNKSAFPGEPHCLPTFYSASHLADPGADCCGLSAGRISADIKATSLSWVYIQHHLLTGQPGRGKGWGPNILSRINPSVLAKGLSLQRALPRL